MEFIKNLSPAQKKWGVIAVIGAGIIGVSSMQTEETPQEKRINLKENLVQNVLTTFDTREVGLDNLAAQISSMKETVQQFDYTLKTNDKRLDRLETRQNNPIMYERQLAQLNADLAKMQEEQSNKIDDVKDVQMAVNDLRAEILKIYESGVPLGAPGAGQPNAAKPNDSVENDPEYLEHKKQQDFQKYYADQTSPPEPQTSPDNAAAPSDGGAQPPQSIPAPILSEIKFDDVSKALTVAEEATIKKVAEDKKKKSEMLIPMGSIITGRLINGLDAPTSQGARKDPFPVVLRVKKEVLLPNYYTADLNECHIILSGYGDLSTERVMLRTEGISCVTNDGYAIEAKAEGYAAGSDGKAGVRGRLVSKQGQMIANSMLAASIGGFASAFGSVPIPIVNTQPGSNTEQVDYASQLSSAAISNGMIKGAQAGLERVADFFLDMADAMYPVLELDADREIDIILVRGVSLPIPQKS